MISGHTHRPGTARVLAVCALLLGLFAMHGLPASAADGCHSRMAAAPMPAMADGMAPAASENTAPAYANMLLGSAQLHHDGQAQPTSASCVSTLVRDRIAPAALALLSAGLLWITADPRLRRRVASFLVQRHRGPPTAGRSLLNQVCISRT